MPIFPTLHQFYTEYEAPLARLFYKISQRGLQMDLAELAKLREYITGQLTLECDSIAKQVGQRCVYTAKQQKELKKSSIASINLGSDDQLKVLLKDLGLKIPKNRKTGKETTNEAALFALFGETGNEVLNRVLSVGELNHMLSNFVNAELLGGVYYSDYSTTGAVTGRRSSSAGIFGEGGNGQNLPKHTKLGKMMRRCVVARPGSIFLACDQRAAEDWVVWGIIADESGDESGIVALQDTSIKRHQKLASFVFAKPYLECDKSTMLYYLAKKTRHGNNYGMRGYTMSISFASERISMTPEQCDWLLVQANKAEPQIKGVFQPYVEKELLQKRELRTPIGRRRFFLNLRNNSDNSATFRDGYSYIPQSTVGDNTGLAELNYEAQVPNTIVGDHHDAMLTEIRCSPDEIRHNISVIEASFDRTLEFPKGFRLKIPVEFELGFNLRDMHTVTIDTVEEVLAKCQDSLQPIGSLAM